jgi:lichenan operon transcriptional antiterminator
MDDRQTQLLAALEAARGPMSGAELGERLHVSSRSVREYVRSLNRQAGRDLVTTSHRGYTLDADAHALWRARKSTEHQERFDTPQQRLYFITRRLITTADTGADVFELADSLFISPATIEADLGRARELLREFHLRVRRDHDLLYLEGSERDQRRFVRQVLLAAGQGLSPLSMQGFAAEFPDHDLRALRTAITARLAESEIDIDEYALNDLVIHLTIAADRVAKGHTLPAADPTPSPLDPEAVAAADRLADAVHEIYSVPLPESERTILASMLAARRRRQHPSRPDAAVRPESLQLVRDAMRELSGHYLLEFYDESTIVDLALHVQALIDRARQNQGLRSPLGESFKNLHPLIHELALFFAERIEEHTGVSIEPGEVDFLSFHLGTQFQRQLEQGPPVSLTLVVPRYRDTHETILNGLSGILGDQAVISDVVTTLDHDWDRIPTDLVVSTVDLSELTRVPTVTISPFLGHEDIQKVIDAVRTERKRDARQKIRSAILTLIEPRLFHHVASVAGKEEALAMMCDTLLAEGLTHAAFYGDVVDRERRSSTSFGGQFAIPHSMNMDAYRPGISVLVTDRPIPWGSSRVRLVVLFALSPDSRGIFRDVLDEFIRVLSEPDNITALINAGDTHESFVRKLAAMLS